MNIEFFREYCLALDGVTEKTPFGKFARRYDSVLVFYVSGHMFCLIDMDNFSFVDLPSSPEEIGRLRDTYTAVGSPLNRAFVNWVRLGLNEDIPDHVILAHVRRAHSIIEAKYRKSARHRSAGTECSTRCGDDTAVQLGLDSCGD